GLLGVVSLAACASAASLQALIVGQLAAGVAWALALTSASTIALGLGYVGREGLVSGILFSMLAAAALARLATTVTGARHESVAMAPIAAWIAASLIAI